MLLDVLTTNDRIMMHCCFKKKRYNMKTAKKPASKTKKSDDLASHYDFDYSKAKPNRFAGLHKDQMIVLLDKEFTRIFKSPDEVTNALRSLIHAFPKKMRSSQKNS